MALKFHGRDVWSIARNHAPGSILFGTRGEILFSSAGLPLCGGQLSIWSAEIVHFLHCFRMAVRYHGDVRSVVLLGRFLYRVERRAVAGDAFSQPVPKVRERIEDRRDWQRFFKREQRIDKRKRILRKRGEGESRREMDGREEKWSPAHYYLSIRRNLWNTNTSSKKGIASHGCTG